MRRMPSKKIAAFSVLLCLIAPSISLAQQQGIPASGAGGFVGAGRCGNPTCHGAALPATEAEKADWRPYKSARSQWINRNIDRHSRAYVTLETPGGKAIAHYMGISSTTSDRCLTCHAPAAKSVAGSAYRRAEGVTCEHCHGPAENWLTAHVERDWATKKASFVSRGFYDNANFKLRAQRCAACHTDLDHEIVAAGHPPLQFEMVAYAQIMKHWDDQEDQPAGAFSVDPALWAVGQAVGLGRTMEMVAARAGESDYQSIGKFSHFKDSNCYQCHHKLVADALRQAEGHYAMVEQILAVRAPDRKASLTSQWNGVMSAARSDPAVTQQKAKALADTASGLADSFLAQRLNQSETRRLLKGITSSGATLRAIDRSAFSRASRSNVLTLSGVDLPWWYTTGAPEQAVLAIGALCDPAYGAGVCRGLKDERKSLLGAVDRFSYSPDQFQKNLGAINAKLP